MGNFDLSALALKAVCPGNDLLYDDKGLPSVMVYVPKFKISDVITGGSNSVHPAFIINGTEVDGIWISKYQNIVKGGRAYSLPCEDPGTNITFDSARQACEAKGEGWHLMTLAEFKAIALWCKKHGIAPKGNNNYGKDSEDSTYDGIPTTYGTGADAGKIFHIATGSGPISYSHDGTLSGIWDLNGNVTEWQGGARLVHGELQILANNNAADADNSQAANSAQWKAIDGTDGSLITPNGFGTTTNSLKLDYVSSAWKWITGTISSSADSSRNCAFASVTADNTVCAAAQELLYTLGLLPDSSTATDYHGDALYANNAAEERLFSAGGHYSNGASAGVFVLFGNNTRSLSHGTIGFRAAFVNLPSA